MKKLIITALVLTVMLCMAMAGCDAGADSDSGSVTSIRLKYNGSTISTSGLTVKLSDGVLTFTADVEVTGGASKDFSLESSNSGIAAASGKTVTPVSPGRAIITATAAADSTKKNSITLIINDDNEYIIIVNGGLASVTTAIYDQIVTLTPGTEAGKEFSDWTIDPPGVTMVSPSQFKMPSSNVTVTGNFSEPGTGAVPYFVTNMLSQDSATAHIVQWHNDTAVATQTLQIVAASGSFDNARTIPVTGERWEATRAPGADVGDYPTRNVFRTEVSGLSPNTLYKYRMGEAGAWSKTFTCLTASGNNADFSFTVLADPQNHEYSDMIATMKDANAFDDDNRFFIDCGDVANYIGYQPLEIQNYTNEVNEINIRRPVATTQGNHDTYYNVSGDTYIFGNAEVFNKFTVFPENGWQGKDQYRSPHRSKSYYFYYNRVLFIVLNTMSTQNPTGTGEPNHTAQAAWLEEVLATDKAQGASKFRIVATHVSPFGGRSSERWLQPAVREAYGKMCTDYNVDIFFAGHDHVYGRSHPIKIIGNTAATTTLAVIASENPGIDSVLGPNPGGVVYSIVGATGPKFYTIEDTTWVPRYFPVRYSQPDITPGTYVNVKVIGDRLVVTARKTGSSVPLDYYEVEAK